MPDNELQREWASRLAELARSGMISRRDVLRKASAYGLSIPAIAALIAAFGTDDDTTRTANRFSPVGRERAASPSVAPMSPPVRGGTLSVGALTPSTAVDPVIGFDSSSIAIFQLTHEYLIGLNRDFTLRQQLATEWEPAAGGQQRIVTIRPGVTFTDGTAQSAFAGILEAGGVSVQGTDTVVFDLVRPYADFSYLISSNTYNAVILPPDYAGNYTESPIGTGPFVLDSYSASDGTTIPRCRRPASKKRRRPNVRPDRWSVCSTSVIATGASSPSTG